MEKISIKGDENDPWRPETIHTIRGFFSLLYKHTICGSVYSPFHSYFSLFFPIQLFIFFLISAQAYAYPQTGISLSLSNPIHLISFTFFLCFYIYVIFLLIINHFFLSFFFLVHKPLLSINSFLGYFEGSNIILYHGSNMLTVYAPRAILNFHLYQDSPSTQQTYYSCKINNVNFINFNPAFPKPYGSPCRNIFLSSSFSWYCVKRHKCLVIKHAMLPQFFFYFGPFDNYY